MQDIKITSWKTETLKFEVSGIPEGEYILQTEYKYYLVPFEPGFGLRLICQSESIAEVISTNAGVVFHSRATMSINTKSGKLPNAVELLSVAMVATECMNQDLKKLLWNIEGMPIFEITPVNIEESLPLMLACLRDAYPEQ